MTAIAIIAIITGGVSLFCTLVGCTWYLAARAERIDTKMELLLTNHLPHIEARLERVENLFLEGHIARTD